MKIWVICLAWLATGVSGQDTLCGSFFTPCTACYDGFFDNSTQSCVVATETVDNCMEYDSDGVCNFCDPGYLMINNVCAEINLPNCLFPATIRSCATCSPNILNERGSCGTVTCKIQNCRFCSQTPDAFERCDRCEENFSLDYSTNTCYRSNLTNCRKGYYDRCYWCDYGFYNNNGYCYESDSQRRIVDTSNVNLLAVGFTVLMSILHWN